MKLYYKKNILLLVIGITISLSSFTQISEIEKATIINHKLFVPVSVSPGKFMEINFREASAFLRTFNLDKVNKPTFTSLRTKASSPKFEFPITYDIQDTLVFPIAFSEGNNRISPSFSFFKTRLINEDTNAVVSKIQKKREMLEKKYPDKTERRNYLIKELEEESKFYNSKKVSPLMCLIYSYSTKLQFVPYDLSYDILSLKNSHFTFIMRDQHIISLWDYNYKDDDGNIKAWKEIKTFSIDSIHYSYNEGCTDYKIDAKKIIYGGISDSLFFQGHFKAIRQGENTFLINQSHGAIYWIGENAIYKVGQIDLENYKQQLLNQKLFIEDRDNNQIIFFSNVERLSTEFPFPAIQLVLTGKDFEKKFGYVLKSIDYLNN